MLRLIRLMYHHRSWGLGLSNLYLRNVMRLGWDHKQVYLVYRIVKGQINPLVLRQIEIEGLQSLGYAGQTH